MQIIEATWEKRNLNCEAYEINIEKEDLNDIKGLISNIEKNEKIKNSYTVIKTPVANLELIHHLQKIGFEFMETQFEITRKVTDPLPKYMEKLSASFEIEYIPKDKERWDEIISLITENLFTTDRVYLDYTLPSATSSIRYKNWLKDLYDNPNAWMAIIKKNEEPWMFNCCINKPENKRINYLLAGVFEKYKNSGMGTILPIPTIKYGVENNFDIIESSISSNNIAILRLYEYYNFTTQNAKYVLRLNTTKRRYL